VESNGLSGHLHCIVSLTEAAGDRWPRCPALNPQENVWQFLRDNWLSNRAFKSYEDILDHCCYAWNKLIEQPWRIMSIGMGEWAYRS
jgi:hypothetical protein